MSEDVAEAAPVEAEERDDYSEEEDRHAVYEYVGMLTASLGFFVPLLTLPVAGYCAYQIRDWKPVTALLLVALAITTIVFWMLVLVFIITPPSVSRLLGPLPGVPESQFVSLLFAG
jgi:hypothetical protein